MGALPPELAREHERLFPDVTLDAIDAERHADFVIERVLEQGTMASVAALVRLYGRAAIRAFLCGAGTGRVSARTRALWRAYLGLDEGACKPASSPRISSPFWRP